MVVAQERYDYYSLPGEDGRVNRRPKRGRIPDEGRKTLALLVLLTFCTGMLIAFYYTQVIISGYKLYSLNNDLVSLRQETVSLAEEIDRLGSLDRIEHLATTKLKMVRPDVKDVVVVKADIAGESGRKDPAGAMIEPGGVKGGEQAETGQGAGVNKIVQAFANLIGIRGS